VHLCFNLAMSISYELFLVGARTGIDVAMHIALHKSDLSPPGLKAD